MNLTTAAVGLLMGLILVTVLDTLGAISSRKAGYNYAYLAPLSFIVYLSIGYFLSKAVQIEIAILLTGIVGIYDGTIGWKLALALKANMPMSQEDLKKMTIANRVVTMAVFSGFLGYVGYSIGAN